MVLVRNAHTVEDIQYKYNFRRQLDFYPVYHVPGAVGYVYKYSGDVSIYYTGDVCLKNGFYSFKEDLNQLINNDEADKLYVILDCTMIGKKEIEVGDDTVQDILMSLENNIYKRNAFFISKSPETLFYSYIGAFFNSIKTQYNTYFVLNDNIYHTLKTVWKSWLKNGIEKDIFIKNLMNEKGTSLANFAESQKLYSVSNINQFRDTSNVIFLLTIEDINMHIEIKDFIKNQDVILVGPWVLKERIPEIIIESYPRSLLRISSPNWSFHSACDDVMQFINDTNSERIKFILFHNYSKTLKKFIKENEFGNATTISKNNWLNI